MSSSTRWKAATLVAVLVAALAWAVPPATSHVAGWKHNWKAHIMPLADKRYYTKKQSNQRYQARTLAPGATLTGVWAAAAGTGGYGVVPISFDSRVLGTVTPVFTQGTTANCPGAGQADAGYLCVYGSFVNSMTLEIFGDTQSGGVGVRPDGTALYLVSSAGFGNARGSWTVRAPLTSARTVAPRSPSGSPDTTR